MKTSMLASVLCLTALSVTLSTARAEETTPGQSIPFNPLREAYYGDLHLHTSYSFDAYVIMGTKIDPEGAYRFAKGEAVEFMGQKLRRRDPLDFLAVTDHSETIGVFNQLEDPDSAVSQTPKGKEARAALAVSGNDPQKRYAVFARIFLTEGKKLPPDLQVAANSAWSRTMAFANRYNEPGKFTTFIAYEWSSLPNGMNLHRNVIFKGDAAPTPFTAYDSQKPEDLWAYLENARKAGYEALAISHNANASNGLMYDWTTLDGKPIDRAYAEMHRANEPLAEISQSKGASETHPSLSPTDEFANFEKFDHLLISTQPSKPAGSYMRDALSRGMILQRKIGLNPFKDGVTGGSDIHTGLSVSAQADYTGNLLSTGVGATPLTHEQAANVLADDNALGGISQLSMTSGNLTGAWAESNTRDSLYAAFRRKETFATSGSRLKFRFFGGWSLDKTLLQQKDWIKAAYATGVPMGGDLPPHAGKAGAPSFAIWAVKDPNAANLDRVQVIKIWEEDGRQKEKIFDVAWSGSRKIDVKTGKLPAVGNTVDLKTGHYTNTIGVAELKTMWTDPDFNPDRLSAYYLRVLEIPTPRWSTLLAISSDLPIPTSVEPTLQQRGWSSAIWYTPRGL